uniref:Uncharacterized protein n=1 Tax=Eutreptiella gymnastica TaxID=73025 RepID=A0A7S1NP43_9EUGL|mmetsp:Transcript_70170/g.123737  ORF Transcript_70170/g.123737 Transcript_70170/m.123737 type:complete len:169 (+) Transcript_70170:583-1089(+)
MWDTPMPRTSPSPCAEIPWPKRMTVYHHKQQTGHPDLSAHIPVSRVVVLGPAGSTTHTILCLSHWMSTTQRGCFTWFQLARAQEYLLFLAASPQGHPGVLEEDGAAWLPEQGLGEGWAPLIITSATGWDISQGLFSSPGSFAKTSPRSHLHCTCMGFTSFFSTSNVSV